MQPTSCLRCYQIEGIRYRVMWVVTMTCAFVDFYRPDLAR